MPDPNSSNRPNGSNGPKKRKTSRAKKNDPFAKPAHPLGYTFISEERPIRATKFGSLLPSITAKYGLGRRLGAERFQNAWRETITAVFAEQDDFYAYQSDYGMSDSYAGNNAGGFGYDSPQQPDKAALFLKYAKPVSVRGGVLRVEIVSNLLFQELQFYQTAIVQRLQALLPNENIRSIKFVVK